MSAKRSKAVRRARRTTTPTAAVAAVALGLTGGAAVLSDVSAAMPGLPASAQQAPSDEPVRITGFDKPGRPGHFTEMNGAIYFTALTRKHGEELWRTDGTPGGTTLVMNVRPGAKSSGPTELTAVGDRLYFTASTDGIGRELWRTGGTTLSTFPWKDVRPGKAGSDPRELTDIGGTLFFTAKSDSGGRELWRSDADGTARVADLHPSSGQGSLFDLTPGNDGEFFFVSSRPGQGNTLWKSDGTSEGTVQVSAHARVDSLAWVDGALYFAAKDEATGYELWTSDGTPAGTRIVRDIDPGAGSSDPGGFTGFDGQVYFAARTETDGRELWRTDGTEAGTVMVKDINPARHDGETYPYYSFPWGSRPAELTPHQGALYFAASSGDQDEDTGPDAGRELWRTDGTEAGTVMVTDINPGSEVASSYGYDYDYDDANDGDPRSLTSVGDQLYFKAYDSSGSDFPSAFNLNDELWRSDGTAAGTSLVAEIDPRGGSGPSDLTAVGETVYFAANDGERGAEAYRVGPPQPNSFSITKGKVDRRNGLLTLKVRVPTGGVVRLDPHNSNPVKRKRVTIGDAGTAKVVLKLKRQGRAELRRQLRKGKKVARVEVKLRMSFAPTSGGDDGVKVRKFAVEKKR